MSKGSKIVLTVIAVLLLLVCAGLGGYALEQGHTALGLLSVVVFKVGLWVVAAEDKKHTHG